MQVALVGLLDIPAYNYTRNLQVQLSDLFATKAALKLEPHFTLKYKFDTGDLVAAEQYFDALAKHTEPFEVTVLGIGAFEKNVAFLDIAKNPVLTSLHLKILRDVDEKFSVASSEFEGENLHFDITLAYKDIDDETFQKIKDYLKNRGMQLQIFVRRIGMYLLPNPEDQWFLYKIGGLKG